MAFLYQKLAKLVLFLGGSQTKINVPYGGSSHPLRCHDSLVGTGEHWRTHEGELWNEEVREHSTLKPTEDDC